jgi:hypothetical protein
MILVVGRNVQLSMGMLISLFVFINHMHEIKFY